MTFAAELSRTARASVEIRVRGIVQGVGFRPTVWRIARDCGLSGEVRNDGTGVLIEVAGEDAAIASFMDRLVVEAPPLSRISSIERIARDRPQAFDGFVIAPSRADEMHTAVTPDAALCAECRAEILSPAERRFRYPLTNCMHCGPRFSIVTGAPYDRATTTMAPFAMCEDCAAEYGDPTNRRFHAQPIACSACGPHVTLVRFGGAHVSSERQGMHDDVDAAARLIVRGEIIALKGLGGFHLACDATNAEAVAKLRSRKRRSGKPFALMARDLDAVLRYCRVGDTERRLLESPEAPIVLLDATGPEQLPEAVAPGLDTLGLMLPYTPLHVLLLERLSKPVVMTSGNISDEPQVIDNEDAATKLAGVARFALVHDRDIANRVDDSVVRVMANAPRLLRRARGYAPGALALPPGFEAAPNLLAFGGELKATFCLVKDAAAILSQHQGDLEEMAAFEDYQKNLALYAGLYHHRPTLLVADQHPEYLSRKLAREWADDRGLPLIETQHHHAHIAACLAENGRARDAAPVLGVALDGAGWGDDGTIWGGEFLLADYRGYRRLGTFKPVALLGGARAMREPWRNTYAHLTAAIGWQRFARDCSDLDLFAFLEGKPRAMLDRMLEAGVNVPLASSCGRLFDAVAAAVGLAREHATFEGEGAMLLEAAVDHSGLESEERAYPFAVGRLAGSDLPSVEPAMMWQALLEDLRLGTAVGIVAARFHQGLANAIAAMVDKLAKENADKGEPVGTVALSGGCFHNRVLLEATERRLSAAGFTVLMHARVPAGDGGLALGQAAIAAARAIEQVRGSGRM